MMHATVYLQGLSYRLTEDPSDFCELTLSDGTSEVGLDADTGFDSDPDVIDQTAARFEAASEEFVARMRKRATEIRRERAFKGHW
ncbi:hypothetical protein [Nocardiopsis lucentensis]|uniref:hypothetical protein n=1 Tax=Nocardiopsis lucentensis TaxID=53441 RepID=UPI00037F9EDC|nr:hypothetical protein [Nocardiopsis lucentensis]